MDNKHPLLDATLKLVPLHQGKFTGLCGLYSILNAAWLASLATNPLSPQALRQLFRYGIDLLAYEGLLECTLKDGMDPKTWIWLTDKILDRSSMYTNRPFTSRFIFQKHQKLNISDTLGAINSITRDGKPVLLMLGGAYDHYSVAIGIHRCRLFFFDSCGYRWISLDACDLQHRRAKKRHRIHGRLIRMISMA